MILNNSKEKPSNKLFVVSGSPRKDEDHDKKATKIVIPKNLIVPARTKDEK